ncbi:hypothetical protein ETU37_08165 [Nocardioides iriomotensis]|uniref:Uncharacterized protein n=1 Tax=Nocardioides iriomotensis TaxID=715784 RepID=A0A4Q5J2S6_9ACTN|nr:hypothetical protein ETU37_08165 [Nocardioides iriomotensis]
MSLRKPSWRTFARRWRGCRPRWTRRPLSPPYRRPRPRRAARCAGSASACCSPSSRCWHRRPSWPPGSMTRSRTPTATSRPSRPWPPTRRCRTP